VSFLWDTCILSDLGKPNRDPLVVEYLASMHTQDTYISVITVSEIEYGLKRLPAGRRRQQLEDVMEQIISEFSPRILPVSVETARIWGQLSARVRQQGFDVETADGLIAATAMQHGLHVVTRNVKDFEPTGVLIVNPWEVAG
jgi:predicted nucleic acid-binding protein